jgi:hypothetical protein
MYSRFHSCNTLLKHSVLASWQQLGFHLHVSAGDQWVVWAGTLESYNAVFVKSFMVAQGFLEATSTSAQIQHS